MNTQQGFQGNPQMQQQFSPAQMQAMYAAQYGNPSSSNAGAGMMNFNQAMFSNPQGQPHQQQPQSTGGINPAALMNNPGMGNPMNMNPRAGNMSGMNGTGGPGGGMGMSQLLAHQQQVVQLQRQMQQNTNSSMNAANTANPNMGINPGQLMNQPQSMGGNMNGLNGMTAGMNGMGGMQGMAGLGSINPAALSAGIAPTSGAAQNVNNLNSPSLSHQGASHPTLNNGGSANMGNSNMANINLTPQQRQQLNHMSPQDRAKAMHWMMNKGMAGGAMYGSGMGGYSGQVPPTPPAHANSGQDMINIGGIPNMNIANMGSGVGAGMGGMGGNASMANMGNMGGGMSGMNMANMNPMQLQMMQAQMGMGGGGQHGQQGLDNPSYGQTQRPPSSASHGSQNQTHGLHSSPPLSQGQLHIMQAQAHFQQQSQQHVQGQGHAYNQGLMGPPSQIPPRPPTTVPSRPGTAGGVHPPRPGTAGGMPGHQQFMGTQGQMPGQVASPRPGTTGSMGGVPGTPRAGSAQAQTPSQQPQQQQNQPHAPTPVPAGAISAGYARPPSTVSLSGRGAGSPAPARPATAQSQHRHTPAPDGLGPSISRPGTAMGSVQAQQPQMGGQQVIQQGQPGQIIMQRRDSQHSLSAGSPAADQMPGHQRKASGVGIPGTMPGMYPHLAPGAAQAQVQFQGQMPGQGQPQAPGMTRVPSGMGGMSPTQLANMRNVAGMPGAPGGMGGMPNIGSMSNMSNAGNIGNMANMNAGTGSMSGVNVNSPSGMMGPPVLPRAPDNMGMNGMGGMGVGMSSLPGNISANGMGVGVGGMGLGGMGGVQAPGLTRQSSAEISRNANAAATAAGLSINTNVNPNMANMGMNGMSPAIGMSMASMGMGGGMTGGVNASMMTPTTSGSPMIDGQLPHPPVTPRQASQPPGGIGSPYPPVGGMGMNMNVNMSMGMPNLERKSSGPIPAGGVLGNAAPITRISSETPISTPGLNPPPAPGTPIANGANNTSGTPGVPSSQTPAIIHQLPPLPTNVSLNPKVTRVSIVPLIDSPKLIPPLTAEEIADVQKWQKADKEYEAVYKRMKERMAEEMREVINRERGWWEKNPADDPRAMARRKAKFEVTGWKTRDERRKRAGKREGFKLPRIVDPEDSNKPEQLVPIRLEFDVEHHKMRDTFVWNLNDPVITPEIFAQSIVDDYSLPSSYHAIITKSIQDQLNDYKTHSATFGEDGVPFDVDEEDVILNGQLDNEEAAWWEAWRNNVRSENAYKSIGRSASRGRKRRKIVKGARVPEVPAIGGQERPMGIEEFEEDESKMQEEIRILVKLDIVVGQIKLEDQIEWDLDSPDPAPENFADVYCKELGLGGEFRTAIAHAIREQVQTYQKSLFLVGHPADGSVVQDDDLRMSFLPSLSTGARSMDQVGAFTPLLNYLSDSELERNEKEREKELNRRRRKTARGRRGIALPDREPLKTFRTPAIGFPDVDPATFAANNVNIAPTSRRAAAAAASLTIANMVASENGTAIMPQTIAAPVQIIAPVAVKEKKPKGLFKAPDYPSSVLRPRANVKAPTPSTAAEPSSLPPPLENDLPAPIPVHESSGARVLLTVKKTRELEREAKEKEYVDGQHANYIDGVWHCSNCGCPEHIAIGRRKGPLGDKSQCGTCGKYWHRHRRPRPVEYNSDPEYHLGLKRAEEQARVAASRKKRPPPVSHDVPKAETVEPETPGKSRIKVEEPSETPAANGQVDEIVRPPSPTSSTSSISEAPLATNAKPTTNGSGSSTHERDASEGSRSEPPPLSSSAVSTTTAPASASSSARTTSGISGRAIPQWLRDAMTEMQERYPDDNFEVILRRSANGEPPGWRIKCPDCPGKLYTPGPGDTLTNYEVHLRNRLHRQKVIARVNETQP